MIETLIKCGRDITGEKIDFIDKYIYIDDGITIGRGTNNSNINYLYMKGSKIYCRTPIEDKNAELKILPREGLLLLSNIDFAAKIISHYKKYSLRDTYFALLEICKNANVHMTTAVFGLRGITFYIAFDLALLEKNI
jgi:hypothetical protein